ncbi:MAG: tetratricopeptide repeat protein, partial [Methanococcaceae archaeon]
IEKPDGIIYYFIGECHEKLEDYNSAIEYFRKSTQLDKEIADAWIGLGVAYEEIGDIKLALRFVKKGLTLDPQNPEYLATYAVIQQHAGLFEDAAESYTLAAKYGPDDLNIWLDFSAMYAELDEYKTALTVIDLGISLQPDNEQLQVRKVAYLYLMGKPKDAIAQLQFVMTFNSVYLGDLFEYAPFLKDDALIAEIIHDRN